MLEWFWSSDDLSLKLMLVGRENALKSSEVSQINEEQRNIGRTQIPERYQVFIVRDISHEKPCVFTTRAHAVMSIETVAVDVGEAQVAKDFVRKGCVGFYSEVRCLGGLSKNGGVINSYFIGVRKRAKLKQPRIGHRIGVIPNYPAESMLARTAPVPLLGPVKERVLNIEKIRSCLPKLTINKQLVVEKWVYQVWVFVAEGLQFRRVAKSDDVIGPENIN